ncbi:MAG: ATP-dependent helicase [Deltaproteobacteria bacterium HGW-Deltaproteobacteria-14]|jgi:hypothetical protein|nr:MAG: ATP-dependent helicase [Deltaproteobacteria bacterium HGW-Deltaproteobacteria-14]
MSSIRPRRTVSAPPRRAAGTSSPATTTRATAQAGYRFALDVPFAMRAVASASGARWDADAGAFLFVGDALPPGLAPFRAQPYSLEERVERQLNGAAFRRHERPTGPALVPRPHQREAVTAIGASVRAGHQGFLLADDVGLGKTITAWQAILEMPKAKTVLITCPLAVVAHWRRTIAAMGDGGREVTVLNYERLGKLFELTPKARAKVKSKKGLARSGTAAAFDVLVWDESHRCKNPAAARSKLAAKLNAAGGFALWLSATAGQNPLELSYLAPLLARVTGDKPGELRDFEAWCQKQGLGVRRGQYGRWEWDSDPADCEKVRGLLFDGRTPAGVRRRPEEIAGWPELNRILTPIALDGEARALYDAAWTEFRRELELEQKGKNPRSALAATLRLRQKGSLLRVPGTAELVRELLDNGHQVAVSVAFLESLEALRDDLEGDLGPGGCAIIAGALSADEKESERLRFQRGDARVVLFTVEEGISLHQGEHNEVPRSEVIHDLRWSAIQMAQIEGRCHRDGRFAQVYWAYADDTLEERIANVVCGRLQSMKGMVGDDTDTLREIGALLAEPAR